MDPKRIGWWTGLVAAIIITWMLTRSGPAPYPIELEEPAAPPSVETRASAPKPNPMTAGPLLRPPPNPVAAKLNDPNLTAEDDVANVHQLLEQMFGVWKTQRRPMSLNAEFTRALTGDNPARLPFIASSNPAVVDGELVDRFGEPYQFHIISLDRIEVRSAGPDQRLYTDDDALYSPWTKAPPGGAGNGASPN